MSWDILLINKHDGKEVPLGARADVLAAVTRAFPEADLSDPSWGIIVSEEWSIEVNSGHEDPVESVMLHVRGGGDADEAALRIAEEIGCSTIDCSTGEPLTPDGPNGWQGFQNFRDRVLGLN